MRAYMEVCEGAVARRLVPTAAPTTLEPLLRWTGTHALTALLGLMRRPAVLNRQDSETPDWKLNSVRVPDAAPHVA